MTKPEAQSPLKSPSICFPEAILEGCVRVRLQPVAFPDDVPSRTVAYVSVQTKTMLHVPPSAEIRRMFTTNLTSPQSDRTISAPRIIKKHQTACPSREEQPESSLGRRSRQIRGQVRLAYRMRPDLNIGVNSIETDC